MATPSHYQKLVNITTWKQLNRDAKLFALFTPQAVPLSLRKVQEELNGVT